jgi:hypothetical protein
LRRLLIDRLLRRSLLPSRSQSLRLSQSLNLQLPKNLLRSLLQNPIQTPKCRFKMSLSKAKT